MLTMASHTGTAGTRFLYQQESCGSDPKATSQTESSSSAAAQDPSSATSHAPPPDHTTPGASTQVLLLRHQVAMARQEADACRQQLASLSDQQCEPSASFTEVAVGKVLLRAAEVVPELQEAVQAGGQGVERLVGEALATIDALVGEVRGLHWCTVYFQS